MKALTLLLFFAELYFAQDLNLEWITLNKEDLKNGEHHTKHYETFGKYTSEYNLFVLKAIDKVQSTALDGGGYFADIKADPPESPIGYGLKLFEGSLIKPARTTSYCSGSSYSAFIEALNLIYSDSLKQLSNDRLEAMRMQEPDGGRREDDVKFWGKWNADGYGNQFALVQYSGMGKEILPENAQPGDFMNISWKKEGGHSVIFLGWFIDESNVKNVVYWSSQKGTNGLGDGVVPIDLIKEVLVVRLVNPENLFNFDPETTISNKISGNKIEF